MKMKISETRKMILEELVLTAINDGAECLSDVDDHIGTSIDWTCSADEVVYVENLYEGFFNEFRPRKCADWITEAYA